MKTKHCDLGVSVCVSVCLCVSRSAVSDTLQHYGRWSARLPGLAWDFPGKNTVVGICILLQGIFPTQGSNPSLDQADSLPPEPPGKPQFGPVPPWKSNI